MSLFVLIMVLASIVNAQEVKTNSTPQKIHKKIETKKTRGLYSSVVGYVYMMIGDQLYPLTGVSVVCKNDKDEEGTKTDKYGHYLVGFLYDQVYEVTFELTGFETIKKHVNLKYGKTELNVVMTPSDID